MADASTASHTGDNSPEHVAFRLFEMIAAIEKKHLHPVAQVEDGWSVADRPYILGTFAECCLASDGTRSGGVSERAAKVVAATAMIAKSRR